MMWPFALVLALAQPPPTAAAERARHVEELRVLIEQKRAGIRDLDNQERSVVDSLGELDEALAKLEDEARAATARATALAQEQQVLEKATARDEERWNDVQARLTERMKHVYVDGGAASLGAIASADGFTNLALRRRLLRDLAKSDARLLGEAARIHDDIAARRQRLQAARDEALTTKRQLDEQTALIAAIRGERTAALARIRDEKQLAGRAATELVDKQRAAQKVLATMMQEPAPTTPLAPARPLAKNGPLKAGLLRPVPGVVIRNFGVIIDKDTRAEIVSNGVEIRAAAGTDVVAAADGVVVYVGWLRGFGRIVILDHGDGHHTLSAHLSRADVEKSQNVQRGTVIGAVGDTESDNGPKLYFELRDKGRPKDPAPYFR